MLKELIHKEKLLKMSKVVILKIDNCVDCPYMEFEALDKPKFYCTLDNSKDAPSKGIRDDCKLENYE